VIVSVSTSQGSAATVSNAIQVWCDLVFVLTITSLPIYCHLCFKGIFKP